MKIIETYGSRGRDVEDLMPELARLLAVELVARQSDFWGEYYTWDGPGDEWISIKPNVTDEDGDLTEADFPDHIAFVTVVDRRQPPVDTLAAVRSMAGLEHLRSQQF
ncbi:hypothetical protein [Pseudonocardia sp. GCM10023141]|uniref:hypothetical protein n=1 Tax=Pseudonocardia sp. GCM10023141 TaxID=3252653 RepID=UPI0036143D51